MVMVCVFVHMCVCCVPWLVNPLTQKVQGGSISYLCRQALSIGYEIRSQNWPRIESNVELD